MKILNVKVNAVDEIKFKDGGTCNHVLAFTSVPCAFGGYQWIDFYTRDNLKVGASVSVVKVDGKYHTLHE